MKIGKHLGEYKNPFKNLIKLILILAVSILCLILAKKRHGQVNFKTTGEFL